MMRGLLSSKSSVPLPLIFILILIKQKRLDPFCPMFLLLIAIKQVSTSKANASVPNIIQQDSLI